MVLVFCKRLLVKGITLMAVSALVFPSYRAQYSAASTMVGASVLFESTVYCFNQKSKFYGNYSRVGIYIAGIWHLASCNHDLIRSQVSGPSISSAVRRLDPMFCLIHYLPHSCSHIHGRRADLRLRSRS